jgi:hypothetical protein
MEITSGPSQLIGLINRTVKTGLRNPWVKNNATNQAGGSSDATLTSSPEAQKILGGYNLENISPREFTELVQKLQSSGAISANDAKELAQIRQALDTQQVNPDEPINLVEFIQQQLATLAQAGGDLGGAQGQAAWVQKLLAAQNGEGTESVNALA